MSFCQHSNRVIFACVHLFILLKCARHIYSNVNKNRLSTLRTDNQISRCCCSIFTKRQKSNQNLGWMMDASSSGNFENVVQNVLKFEEPCRKENGLKGQVSWKISLKSLKPNFSWRSVSISEINSQKIHHNIFLIFKYLNLFCFEKILPFQDV